MIDSLDVNNFTVFKKAHFDFVPGINVLVGANATGKTQLLKLMYVLQLSQMRAASAFRTGFAGDLLTGVFNPEHTIDLIRTANSLAKIAATWTESPSYFVVLEAPDTIADNDSRWIDVTRPVFIPEKDMLANSVGFMSLVDRREIDFDSTYRDILSLAFIPRLRHLGDPGYARILELLAEHMEGTVDVQGDRFYLSAKERRLEMHTVASGWRKLALLNGIST